ELSLHTRASQKRLGTATEVPALLAGHAGSASGTSSRDDHGSSRGRRLLFARGIARTQESLTWRSWSWRLGNTIHGAQAEYVAIPYAQAARRRSHRRRAPHLVELRVELAGEAQLEGRSLRHPTGRRRGESPTAGVARSAGPMVGPSRP